MSAITPRTATQVIFLRVAQKFEEDGVRKRIILAFAGLALLAGCGNQGDKAPGIPTEPKWKGAPYRLALDTKPAKPNPAVITIPPVKYTANPEALETRVLLAMRFTAPAAAGQEPVEHRMIGSPVDIKGEDGTLPADYMTRASKGLSEYLDSYCLQGKVNLSLALARSSLNPQASDAEVDAKRLSDWLPTEVLYKNPHQPKCKP
jgi:hypothetical protein